MSRKRNLPTDAQQRIEIIQDLCRHGVDPETCFADYGEYDSDWETAAAALEVKLPKSPNLYECRAALRPFYWRTYQAAFNPL